MVMVVGAFTIVDSIGSISNIFICDLHDWRKQQNKMKKFTTEEIRDLFNRVMVEEISFTRMVEIMNERVSKSDATQFKDGDFVVNVCGAIIIFKNKVEDSIYDHAYLSESVGAVVFSNTPSIISIERHATEEEKKKILDSIAKEGKRWNEEKKCVEDIQKCKFQKGDKVRVKDGVSSKTHREEYPCFAREMDDLIGKTMTVGTYTDVGGYVVCNEHEWWLFNEDWLEPYVEDIPKRKFQEGDKVKIKNGISSKTMHSQYPVFQPSMDDFIGAIMTVNRYEDVHDFVICNESDWRFNEDWLEPYTDELKKGDLAIFWDLDKWEAYVGKYDGLLNNGSSFPHQDHRGNTWANAIKFESVEQFERFIKGEK